MAQDPRTLPTYNDPPPQRPAWLDDPKKKTTDWTSAIERAGGDRFRQRVREVSQNVEVDPDHLMNVMAAESGFDPQAANPGSSARGLIQWTNDSGFDPEAIHRKNAIDQLADVEAYLRPFKGRLKTQADVYGAVFLPKGLGKDIYTRRGESAYESNRGLDYGNKGYISAADLDRRAREKGGFGGATPLRGRGAPVTTRPSWLDDGKVSSGGASTPPSTAPVATSQANRLPAPPNSGDRAPAGGFLPRASEPGAVATGIVPETQPAQQGSSFYGLQQHGVVEGVRSAEERDRQSKAAVDAAFGPGIWEQSAAMNAGDRAKLVENALHLNQINSLTSLAGDLSKRDEARRAAMRRAQKQIAQARRTSRGLPNVDVQEESAGQFSFTDPKTDKRVYVNSRDDLYSELRKRAGYGVAREQVINDGRVNMIKDASAYLTMVMQHSDPIEGSKIQQDAFAGLARAVAAKPADVVKYLQGRSGGLGKRPNFTFEDHSRGGLLPKETEVQRMIHSPEFRGGQIVAEESSRTVMPGDAQATARISARFKSEGLGDYHPQQTLDDLIRTFSQSSVLETSEDRQKRLAMLGQVTSAAAYRDASPAKRLFGIIAGGLGGGPAGSILDSVGNLLHFVDRHGPRDPFQRDERALQPGVDALKELGAYLSGRGEVPATGAGESAVKAGAGFLGQGLKYSALGATRLPFWAIMGGEAALANQDKPLETLRWETGKAVLLGLAFDIGIPAVSKSFGRLPGRVGSFARNQPALTHLLTSGTTFGTIAAAAAAEEGKTVPEILGSGFGAFAGAALLSTRAIARETVPKIAEKAAQSPDLPENVAAAAARVAGREPIVAKKAGEEEYASVFLDKDAANEEAALNRKARDLARQGDEEGLAEVRRRMAEIRAEKHIIRPLTVAEAGERGHRRTVEVPPADFDQMMENAGYADRPGARTLTGQPPSGAAKLPAKPPSSPEAPRMPERSSTIEAQMDALTNKRGKRIGVLVTPGEAMPDVPDDYSVKDLGPKGRLIFPRSLSGSVAKMLDQDRLGDILGHVNGETPNATIAVVARAGAGVRIGGVQAGDELMSSYVEPGKQVAMQKEMAAQFAPYQPTFEIGGQATEQGVIDQRTEPTARTTAARQPAGPSAREAVAATPDVVAASPPTIRQEGRKWFVEQKLASGNVSYEVKTREIAEQLRDHLVQQSQTAEAPDETPQRPDFLDPLTVDEAAHRAASSPQNDLPEPTPAQIEAGNYKKGHVKVAGLDVAIENPEGSMRRGVDSDGKKWAVKLESNYGYVKRSEGADGEQVDVFLRPGIDADYDGPVFVVNQIDDSKRFDEHKVMLGWPTQAEARKAYLANYDEIGPSLIGSIARFENPKAFKQWLDSGDLKQPAGAVRDLGAGTPHPETGRKYGSTQIDLPPEIAELQKQAAQSIPDDELAADGRESDAHVTVKYGVRDENAIASAEATLRKLLRDQPPITLTIGEQSIFPAKGSADYDVVKMDVDSADLHRINKLIADNVDVTDTHPEYKPHLTLAYVKPGLGAKYTGKANGLTGKTVTVDKVLFSGRDGKEATIRLQGQPAEISKPETEAFDDPRERYIRAREKLLAGKSVSEAILAEFPKLRKLVRAQPVETSREPETGLELGGWVIKTRGIRYDKDKWGKVLNRGELVGLSKKEGFSGVINNKSGESLEDKAHHAAAEGYGINDFAFPRTSKTGELAEYEVDFDRFIDALLESLTGRKSHLSIRYAKPEDQALEKYEDAEAQAFFDERADQYPQSYDALVAMGKNDSGAALLGTIYGGLPGESDYKSFRDLARGYGVRPEDIEAIIKDSQHPSATVDDGPDEQVTDWSDVQRDLQDGGVEAVQRMYETHPDLVERIVTGEASAEDIESFYDIAHDFGVRESDREAILDQGGQYLIQPEGVPFQKSDAGDRSPDVEHLLADAKVEQIGHRLKLNDAGYELFRSLYVNPDPFEGAVQKPAVTEYVRARLRGLNKQFPEYGPQIRDIEAKMRRAAGDNGIVIVFRHERALKHEGVHYASELGAQGRNYIERHSDFPSITRTAAYIKGFRALTRMKYPPLPGLAVEELHAFLRSGQRPLLNSYLPPSEAISEDEAVDFLDAWQTSYEAKNGAQSMEAFEREREEADQIIKDARAANNERWQAARSLAEQRQGRSARGTAADRARVGSQQAVAFQKTGPPHDVVLVACSKRKLGSRAPAKVLYQGELFRRGRAYAEKHGDSYFILSGLHGLLEPDQQIDPYDYKLTNRNKRERDQWGALVVSDLQSRVPAGSTVTLLAGEDYVEPLVHKLEGAGYRVKLPLDGLGVGHRMQKLAEMTKAPVEKRQPTEPSEQLTNRWQAIEENYQRALEAEKALPGVPLKNIYKVTIRKKVPGVYPPSSLPVAHVEYVPRDKFSERERELAKEFPSSEYGSDLSPSQEPYRPRKGEPSFEQWKAGARPDFTKMQAIRDADEDARVEKAKQKEREAFPLLSDQLYQRTGTDAKKLLFQALYKARNKPVPASLQQNLFDGPSEESQPAKDTQKRFEPKPAKSIFDNAPPGGWADADRVPPTLDTKPQPEDDSTDEQPTSRVTAADQTGNREPGDAPDLFAGARSPGERLAGGERSAGQAVGSKAPVAKDAQPLQHGATKGPGPDERPGQLTLGDAGDTAIGGPSARPARVNFSITDELDFRGIGVRTKYRNNVAAIRLVKQLESENRPAIPDEQKVLARYVGWGGIKSAFDPNSDTWRTEYSEMRDLLTPEEYKTAKRSVLNAHYTSKEVVDAIWKAVRRLGLEHGSVLEPTVGTGNFIGLVPAQMKFGTRFTGVEFDRLTGAIAKHLYPQSNIYSPLGIENAVLPREHFDLAIGNPPFGDESLHDSKNKDISKFKIHAFVFAKSLDTVRPGGLLAMVVSKGLLDASDSQAADARNYLAERARLLGAIRLPDTAFKVGAGTEVTTDIIFLQKLAPGVEANPDEWTSIGKLKDRETGDSIGVNKYFVDNPDMMLGEMTLAGTMYRAGSSTLTPREGSDLAADLNAAIEKLPKGVIVTGKPTQELELLGVSDMARPAELRPYNYYLKDGKLYQAMPDPLEGTAAVEVARTGRELQRTAGMIEIRDIVRDLMRREIDPDTTEQELATKRAKLNRVYDRFIQSNGFFSSDVNKRLFRDDADYALVLSLERGYDKGVSKDAAKKTNTTFRAPKAGKADIFTKRVRDPIRQVTEASSAMDAMLASLNEKGRVDLDYMSGLYGKTPNEIVEELGDKVFADPELGEGGYVPRDAYLSGNVKRKLAAARAAGSAYAKNVEALETVQPADIKPADIFVKIGSGWLPIEVYKAFVADTFTGELVGRFAPAVGRFVGLRISSSNATQNRQKWGVTGEGGNSRMSGTEILEALMINKRPVIEDKVSDRPPRWVVNPELTAAAEGKAEELIEHFNDWLWNDPERRREVATLYNELFNHTLLRKFDGAHLTLPGMTPLITMRPHQLNGIYRAIQDGTLLADHVVGAGKTFMFIAIGMEMRRLGLARKPMYIVPNHLVEQWAADFKTLYPGANVLAATRKDFQKPRRKQLFAKISTGDWDAIIVAHSSFGFIPMPPEIEQRMLEEQRDELIAAIEEERKAEGKKSLSVRDLEKAQTRVEEKIARLSDRVRDDLIDFAEMGVDSVFLDEAHEFKNLFFTTQKRNVAGLGDPEGSQKAFDMFIKTRYTQEQNGGKNVFFATGTPVANTISEIFHMQRYLQYDALKASGLHTFDAWANTFGHDVADWEMDAAGRFKQKTRFSKFANLPELKQLWNSVADTVVNRDLIRDAEAQGKRFPLPKVKGGKPQNIVCERSEQQAQYIGVPQPVLDKDGKQKYDEETGAPVMEYLPGTIVYRMDNWLNEFRSGNTSEIPLKITGDARKAGLDYRLIDPNAPDFAGSKVNVSAQNIFETWKANDHRKGTQLVFCDLSTPKAHRGKATARAAEIVPTYFVREAGDTTEILGAKFNITHVAGAKLKLQAAPDHPFFSYKLEGEYIIVNAENGQALGHGRKRGDAVDEANTLIAQRGVPQFLADSAENAIPQQNLDAYVHAFEALKQANEAQLGDLSADPIDQEETVSLDELLADQSEFSVYDDLRAKLIAKGIPEDQVAFIHDYETDLQKQSLFNKVNAGTIRVLLGSTKKMGAGMNVQKRLVGLVHLDCPWRPADLEQREGRGIRQGNEFYEADPDGFELEISRYSTKQTYDARMWEIVEQKARAIETFKTDNTIREIEDVSSESANAADMKAGASGDPRILESIQLRAGIKKLETQERNYRRSRFDLEDAVKAADEKTTRPWTSLAQAQAAQQNVEPKTDETMLKLGSEEFPAKEIKGDVARKVLGVLMPAFKQVSESESDSVRLGTYRGFVIGLTRAWGGVHLTAKDPEGGYYDSSVYTKEDDLSATGFMARVDNLLDKYLPQRVGELESQVKRQEREAIDAKVELEKPFAKAEELAELKERQKVLVAELRSGAKPMEPLPTDREGLAGEIHRVTNEMSVAKRDTLEDEAAFQRLAARERQATKALTKLKGEQGEGGFLNLKALFPKSDDPKRHFSTLGAWEHFFIRGGAELRRANTPSYEAFAQAAGSRAQGAVISLRAANEITQILGGKPEHYHEFLAAGAEGRLRGVEQRWRDMARSLRIADLDEVQGLYENGMRDVFSRVINHSFFEPERIALGNILDYVDGLAAAKHWIPLRNYLADAFELAAQNVSHISFNGSDDWFDRYTATRRFKRALRAYKRLIERPASEAHQMNEGVFSNALGPLDTWFPLVPIQNDGTLLHRMLTGRSSFKPYKRPVNVHNRMAMGLAHRYDLTPAMLSESIGKVLWSGNLAHLLDTLEQAGLVIKLKPGQPFERVIEYKGIEYKASPVSIQDPRTIYKDKRVIHVPGRMALVPNWLKRELKPLLEGDFSDGAQNAFVSALNMIGMAGPLDAVFHSDNVIGALVSGTPFVGTSLLEKTLLNNPLTKKINAIVNIIRQNPLDSVSYEKLMELARMGILPDRFASVTYSRKFAKAVGAKWKPYSFGPALYGPRGIDVSARLQMYDIAKNIAPDASASELIDFIGQMGIYNKAMQSELERALKRAGVAPFFTAGATMLRNGINAWIGNSKIPDDTLPLARRYAYRVAQMFGGGILGLIGLWILLHKLYRGSYPWEEADARLLQIKLRPQHRRTKLAQTIWGHNDEEAYVGLGFLSPMVERGARTLGISGAYETAAQAGSPGQIAERIERDAVNSLIHPVTSGPATHAAFVMVTGAEPYLSQNRDPITGRYRWGLRPAIGATEPGLPTYWARTREGLLSWNNFNQKFSSEVFGIGEQARENEGRDNGTNLVRMALDMAVPRLIKNPYNYERSRKQLAEQRDVATPDVVAQLRSRNVKDAADFYRHAKDADRGKLLPVMMRKVQTAAPGTVGESEYDALKRAGLEDSLRLIDQRRSVERELGRLALKFPQVDRKLQIGATRRNLSDDEYEALQIRANELFYSRLPKAIETEDYKGSDPLIKTRMIQEVEGHARALAEAEIRAHLAPNDKLIQIDLKRLQMKDAAVGNNYHLMKVRREIQQKKLEMLHPNP